MRLATFAILLAFTASGSRAVDVDPAASQFFETRVRPVLAERCYKCHSTESTKLKAELYVDSLAGLIKGGESGTALVPGHPEQSRLIEAIAYKNVDLQMPPKDKLSDQQITDITTWVQQGAIWPGGKSSTAATAAAPSFNLAQRRADHWAWQPVKPMAPPAVQNHSWVRDPVDQFILAALEAAKLHPAPSADKRTLLRRVTFDLIGLPPARQDVDAFLADTSPDALATVVDRLLASPQFGERWARHWLDLARYAETLGHEFDFVLPNTWRYRDYVIRAFNADVPYNQFVTEQIAGDLLPNPRKNPADGTNESVIGTAFLYLGESVHSPVDVRQNQSDLIDNRIDVTGKAILGVTVACARCHDHKFDAIAAADYYAMYGMFESTRYGQKSINDGAISTKVAELSAARNRIRRAAAEAWRPEAARVSASLIAARRVLAGEPLGAVSQAAGLKPSVVSKWVASLKDPAAGVVTHPAYPWTKLAQAKAPPLTPERSTELRMELTTAAAPTTRPGDVELANFTAPGFNDWSADGVGFGAGPTRAGDFLLGSAPDHPVAAILTGGSVSTRTISNQLEGTLRSPSFMIDHRYLLVHAAGHEARINVCVEGLNIIRAPIYGGIKHAFKKGADKPTWITFDLEMWKGRRAYLEFADCTVPDEGDTNAYGPSGWLTVDRVIGTDDRKPPALAAVGTAELMLSGEPVNSVEALAERYQRLAVEAVTGFGNDALANIPNGAARASLLNWLVEQGLLNAGESSVPSLESLLAEARQIEAAIPAPVYSPGAADGNGIDEHVFIRGNHHNIGQVAPRRLLEALGGVPAPGDRGSGRLQMARQMVDPANPLVPRVIVNRVWHHLFGRGLVPSTDNFGVLGEKPSNPALLDALADRFVKEGWSIKRLIRELVLTSTYQMSSAADARQDEADPDNHLLHRMNLRRLEGEIIRDEMLAVSGRLDPQMGGPSVDVHLTAFMEGRGRPSSGPIDGNGRRSIYLGVRRNFLSPMLLAFDTPIPFSAMGRRSNSNVPAQALTLMNDPFVVEQAKLWSTRVLAEASSPRQRVELMYAMAFCRPPTESEAAAALAFVNNQSAAWGADGSTKGDDARPWADLAHVMMNLKEFIFVN